MTIHINQMVLELKTQLNELRKCCELLNLATDNDQISQETIDILQNVKAVADKGGVSMVEAARQIADMKNAETNSNCGNNRFDKREYIKKRFGQDPELAASDSFIGLLYKDVQTQSEQLGRLRSQTILDASSYILHDLLMHGTSEGGDKGYRDATDKLGNKITDYLGKVNWEVEVLEIPGTSSTQPIKQLLATTPASTSKMPASVKKSSDK